MEIVSADFSDQVFQTRYFYVKMECRQGIVHMALNCITGRQNKNPESIENKENLRKYENRFYGNPGFCSRCFGGFIESGT